MLHSESGRGLMTRWENPDGMPAAQEHLAVHPRYRFTI